MNEPAKIAVLGVDSARPDSETAARIGAACLVVGGQRHLDTYADSISAAARSLPITAGLPPVLDAIECADGPVVVLASGDPGFFGIVRVLVDRFGPERLDVVPAISAVATAFARAGTSWDDALVVSAHGRELRRAVNVARAHPKVAILTEPGKGPAEIAAALADSPRTFVIAESLGTAEERVITGDAATVAGMQWTDPNVVVVLDESASVAPKGFVFPRNAAPQSWALDESEFEHRDGMITKREVRALALSRLGPGLGDLIWDLGAGSGSVGVECARFGAAVIAVDRDSEACRLTAANASRHSVSVQVVHGNATEVMPGLPDPDAVFVGGGGADLEAIVHTAAQRAHRAVVVALASVERVEPARKSLQGNGFEADVVLLQSSRLRPLGDAQGFAASNPVFVVSGRRP